MLPPKFGIPPPLQEIINTNYLERNAKYGYLNNKRWRQATENPYKKNYPDESGSRFSGTLSHILDPVKMTDSQTSEKLRDFYNRLIQTDARIKKLKKETEELNVYSSAGDISMKPISDRYKRSLMSINSPPQRRESDYSGKIDLNKFNLYYPPFAAVREYNEASHKPTRTKRAEGEIYDDEPSGIVIEKKKVMVQYGPFDRKRNFPKCSHTPKESKSHEKQLKHPFYKNSQRLDELLDQLLDKNMDKIMANPFELDVLVSNRDKCKHSKQEESITTKNDQEVQKHVSAKANKTTVSETNSKSTEFKRRSIGSDSKLGSIDIEPRHKDEDKEGYGYSFLSTTPLYDIVLSVSTLINSESTESINFLTDDSKIHQTKRKLLQFNEEDDENLGYEDFKEVLSDYMDTHDETDKQVERDRRSGNLVIPNEQKSNQKDIPSIHNPNWKGPMPLYPDELNLIKHGVVQNPKNEISEDVKEILAQKEKLESQFTDKEYIEDYLNNKYDKLAQAYSDYGVLADKKESVTNEKNLATESKVLDHKVVALPGKDEIIKNLSFKGKNDAKLLSPEHEGIQINSNNETLLKSSFNISGILSKHIKYLDDKKNQTMPYHDKPNNSKKIRADPNIIIEENLDFTTLRKQRSLKSVETEDLEKTKSELIDDDIKYGVSSIVPLIQLNASKYDTKTFRNDSVKKILYRQKEALNSSHNKSYLDSSDIFHVLSDWFLTLAKLSGEFKDEVQIPRYNYTPKFEQSTSKPENITNEIMYPMYDADMIENIGHRSRVLMSFDGNSKHVSNKSTNETTVTQQKTPEIIQGKIDTLKKQPFVNDTKLKKHSSEISNGTNSLSDNKENKTVVKRCAGDSNLLFWNDIYDDEYGVKIDYFDNEMRNKHSADDNNFVKRSGQWINKKFKKFGDSIRTGYNSGKYWRRRTTKKRSFRSIKDYRSDNYFKTNQNGLFGMKTTEEEGEIDKTNDFAALRANMKQICQEAIRAVEKTKNIKVREDHQGEVAATSLMQQLVKLMTDLVDFQVQQKTCAKLPPDLADFLKWLTSPSNSDDSSYNQFNTVQDESITNNDNYLRNADTAPDFNVLAANEIKEDPRSECLATLHAVRDLLHQYEDLSDEDKSKMSGVKEYLEDQMDFLTKQITAYNEYHMPKFYRKRNVPIRDKRHLTQKKDRNKTRARNRQMLSKIKIHKYVRKSGIKRTKTTASSIEAIVTSEGVRRKKNISNDVINTTDVKTSVLNHGGKNTSKSN